MGEGLTKLHEDSPYSEYEQKRYTEQQETLSQRSKERYIINHHTASN